MSSIQTANKLNEDCFCVSLDRQALRAALRDETGLGDKTDGDHIVNLIEERCPHLFAAHPVFVSQNQLSRIEDVIRAIESVVAMPSYRDACLAQAPAIAQHPTQHTKGVFFGYDFHVGVEGIGLIEINTNAGGAMLNAMLAKAQRACCAPLEKLLPPKKQAESFQTSIMQMFFREWELRGKQAPLKTIAIVDEQVKTQYLYPEFLLFQKLFASHGLVALVAEPADFSWQDGELLCQGQVVDLIYNRLTDFYLQQPQNAVLREAYLQDAVLITPHPQAHALFADKANLVTLSDPASLQALGVSEEIQSLLLSCIPRTLRVTADNASELWAKRKQAFFKPRAGYGSRATYRGDKLTLRVWQEILTGDYIAQELVAPGERTLPEQETSQKLKFDVRAYSYAGEAQWFAARLYQGQTTNMRTPGGGFAPVFACG